MPYINTKETLSGPVFCADSDFVSGGVRIRLVLMIFMDNTHIQIEKPNRSHLHECSGVILAYLQHTTGSLLVQYINNYLMSV